MKWLIKFLNRFGLVIIRSEDFDELAQGFFWTAQCANTIDGRAEMITKKIAVEQLSKDSKFRKDYRI